jgi:hypothetical protein
MDGGIDAVASINDQLIVLRNGRQVIPGFRMSRAIAP